MKTVFFYGLFMDEDLLKEKGLTPQNARQAYLAGFGLRIGARATLERSDGERSHGTIMQLTRNELEILYGNDGVEDYVPQTVSATDLTGETVEAVTYILPIESISDRNSEYAIALAGIAKKLNLPKDYIAEIKTWI